MRARSARSSTRTGCRAIDLRSIDWQAGTAEIGYRAVPAARGRGLMSAAASLLAMWVLRDQEFERVQIRAATGNVASQLVAEKAGFLQGGIARSAGFIHSARVDLVVYSLIRADVGLEPLVRN